jgi:hypothetical protein
MQPKPRFIQGVFTFEGRGLTAPSGLDGSSYKVPSDKRAQLIYMRAGNSSDELVSLVLMRDGKPMRYFPIGAKASFHVSLAVVEDIFPESLLAIQVAAPLGSKGEVVVDFGLVEVD